MSGLAIAIIGAHGSGKTTLIRMVRHASATRLRCSFLVTGEVSRLCPYPVGGTSNSLAQTWIMRAQFIVERFAESLRMPVVHDRCLIDQYAYYSHWIGNDSVVEDLILASLERYNSVFLLRPNSSYLKDDGLRPTSVEFQREIDNKLNKIVEKLNIPVIYCSDNGPKTIDMVLSKLQRLDCREPLQISTIVNDAMHSITFGDNLLGILTDSQIEALIAQLVEVQSIGKPRFIADVCLTSFSKNLSDWLVKNGLGVINDD